MDSTESSETAKYFRAIEARLENEIQHLADRVAALNSKIGREFGGFREETRKEFAEVKALLRCTLVDLDTRVRRLEAEKK